MGRDRDREPCNRCGVHHPKKTLDDGIASTSLYCVVCLDDMTMRDVRRSGWEGWTEKGRRDVEQVHAEAERLRARASKGGETH